ncbi:MAG TPA: glycoside hydrolase family 3 N-terminal domain-containing protein [Anaerolineales bacterium]|nr:glycoside hydrolase family 3 N-terminal domain-containing protein [Anaerolineales bacterium]
MQASQILENRVTELLSQMSLAEKIGQMTQVEKNSITPEEVASYFIGSVLSGGGGYPTPNTPESWRAMVTGFQQAALSTRLGIPMIYGVDAVHGNNNVIGATIFPHNIGLGASGDEKTVAHTARLTALEMLASGIHWNFAPCVAVPQDIRWGRTYEGYAQDTALVSRLGVAYTRGLQNPDGGNLEHPHAVLASVKHYIGDGGAEWNSISRFGGDWAPELWGEPDRKTGIDQGITAGDEDFLRTVFLPPYIETIATGARNIMVSYTSWGGLKMHAQKYLLTTVLKEELGFTGFLVSDWNGISQIHSNYEFCVEESINAGLDMVMVPFDFKAFIMALTRAVETGRVPMSRIDDAVRRILRVKLELDLFARPFGDETLLARVGSPEHRAIAREAVRHSLVLLKNDQETLPLPKFASTIFVAGQGADDLGMQCGGWTLEWQGKSGNHIPGTTFLQALHKSVDAEIHYQIDGNFPETAGTAEVGLAILGEPPYAEGVGDRENLYLSAQDIAVLQTLRARCKKLVVILYSGRPLLIQEALPLADAFVAAWLPGTEGDGITDVLFGDYPFTGKLSYVWPRDASQVPLSAFQASGNDPLFPLGFGL